MFFSKIILVFFFQVAFNILKVLEIKYTYEDKLKSLLLNTIWINLVSLGSVYISIDALLDGDFVIILFYIAGSVTGKWVAMTKFENIRNRLFNFFQKK
jgi:hypothetical protein